MEAISGCFLQFIVGIFFIWFVMVHPSLVDGLVSAMASVFNLIVLLITQIINAMGK
jgi:hypothetical protein